jgi:TetR/AcrR family transcriptional regulator, transcriptional repressor of bet genes
VNKRTDPKFHRETPEVRRDSLVEATLRCLKSFGHDGVSIRRISAEAGVSIGLINHHFPSKSGLIAEAYSTLANSLQASLLAQAGRPDAAPRERLSGFFHASFAPELIDPDLFNVWIVFWSMVRHSGEMRAVHDRTYDAYRKILEGLLREIRGSAGVPKFKLKRAAIGLSALLDGLWVELSLSPATVNPADAIALCEDWVASLCSGGFPRLRCNGVS